MKITKIKEDKLIFNDNSYITYDTYTHYPYYSLAFNYADFYTHSEVFINDFQTPLKFELFTHLFKHYGCEIIVISEIGSTKLDCEEIFEEIVSLLHCYSMKLYSKRRIDKLKNVLEDKDL